VRGAGGGSKAQDGAARGALPLMDVVGDKGFRRWRFRDGVLRQWVARAGVFPGLFLVLLPVSLRIFWLRFPAGGG